MVFFSRYLISALGLIAGVASQTSRPFLSFPVTIDGKAEQLAVFGDQTVEGAIAAFCVRNKLDFGAVSESLIGALNTRLAAKPADAIIFTFDVSVNGVTVEVHMHEGLTVEDTARNFAEAYGLDSVVEQQVRALFVKQIEDYRASGIAAPVPRTPMLSFTIPVDGVPQDLHHFEGADEVEEVRAFCMSNGFLTEELMNACLPPLVSMVRQGMAPAPEVAPVPVEPLFTMPITVDGEVRSLVYYSGQDPADVARTFLLNTGAGSDAGVVSQLASIIVDRATALAQAAAGEAKLTADPLSVARLFCLNRWGMISDALTSSVPGLNQGEVPVNEDQCALLLSEMILSVDARLRSTVSDPEELKSRAPLPEELFSLTVTVAPGQFAELVFLAGMNPRSAAEEFVARHGLTQDAVPILVQAIQDGLAGAAART